MRTARPRFWGTTRRACTPFLCPQQREPEPRNLGAWAPERRGCDYLLGSPTSRMYGNGVFHPSGNFCLASASEREGAMMTSSPRFQLTGVDTGCFAVSWHESNNRNTSSKLRPVLIG